VDLKHIAEPSLAVVQPRDALDLAAEALDFANRLRAAGWAVNMALETQARGTERFTISASISEDADHA
jgi:hypothetical protein